MTEPDVPASLDDASLAAVQTPTLTDDDQIASRDEDNEAANQAPAEQRPSRARDRIQQLIREKHAAEALAQRSLSEAQALRERLAATGRASDYRTPEDYTRAVAENAVREAGADILSRQASQAQEAASRAAEAAWTETTSDFRAKVPDFDQVAHNPDLAITPVMADAIRESDRGAEIAYYLGKNPTEAARISALPPVSQAIAIARLETRITPAQTGVSRAPEPFTPLSGRGAGGGKRLEDMSFDEYRKARGF